eukprot:CAMPEP_0198203504 /NCGR_PEP_ID=MMETSP1445-20131203/6800_1 /TAXON_ID=36898 /ORGANISM="Pyramimonas sp., Strain CCMP2087" /LENGTH=650 /DNA_ID=CAMNT_0043874929 /DNA_START=321 /DNA_END=2273 /DNA_ORIENTATION=-
MIKLAAPLMGGFFMQYVQGFIGLMFMGRLGANELASATLTMSFFNNAAFTLVAGFLSGMETIGAQALGAMNTEKFVLLCQKGGIITGLVLVPLSVVWWFSGDIFLTLIDDDIAVMAGRCMAMTIPGLFGVAIFEWSKRYLQIQQIGDVIFYTTGMATVISPLLYWFLIHHMDMGVYGGMLSFGLVYVINGILLVIVILRKSFTSKSHNETVDKEGFGEIDEFVRLRPVCRKVFQGWGAYFKVALPSTATLFFEYWAWEAVNMLAPMLPDSDIETAAFGIAFEMCYICVLIPLGISQASCVLVATAIGQKDAGQARRMMKLGYALTFGFSFVSSISVFLLRHEIPKIFSHDKEVHAAASRALKVSSMVMIFDAANQIASGVFRACNWQKLSAWMSLVHYVVGIPVAWFVGVHHTRNAAGLLVGLLASTFISGTIQAVIAFFVIDFQKSIDEMQENLHENNGDNNGDEADEGTSLLDGVSKKGSDSFTERDDSAESDWLSKIHKYAVDYMSPRSSADNFAAEDTGARGGMAKLRNMPPKMSSEKSSRLYQKQELILPTALPTSTNKQVGLAEMRPGVESAGAEGPGELQLVNVQRRRNSAEAEYTSKVATTPPQAKPPPKASSVDDNLDIDRRIIGPDSETWPNNKTPIDLT